MNQFELSMAELEKAVNKIKKANPDMGKVKVEVRPDAFVMHFLSGSIEFPFGNKPVTVTEKKPLD